MKNFAAMQALPILMVILGGGCPTEILGVIVPNSECQSPVDGALAEEGVFDIGPTPALANSYEATLMVKGSANGRISEVSVSFQDENSDPLPTEIGGVTLSLPHVEHGERVNQVEGVLDDDGRGTFAFTLVTKEEAEQFQLLTSASGALQIIAEVQILEDINTAEPFFYRMKLCQQCLVGVGATVENDAFICPDGSPPRQTDPVPCQQGRDDVWSFCSGQ